MKLQRRVKPIIDLFMAVLLLLLMAFQVTGQKFHEWFGAGMLVLFLAHNILNYRWYKNLFKGNYNIICVLQAVVNTSEDLNYGNSDSRATKEQNDSSARPAIVGELPSLDGYENVYLGYPIWWGQAPKIMYTFVETCNFTGKTIIPFCTSGSSGIGSSAENLRAANTNQAVWLTGKRFSGNDSKTEIENWVLELKLS